jgi:pachytene checkpoint protein 2
MEKSPTLLKPTLHIEVAVKSTLPCTAQDLRSFVKEFITSSYGTLMLGKIDIDFGSTTLGTYVRHVEDVEVADYTGPPQEHDFFTVNKVALDIHPYTLKKEHELDPRRRIVQQDGDEQLPARVLALPNDAVKDDWQSLVFDDALPARLLRYLVRNSRPRSEH